MKDRHPCTVSLINFINPINSMRFTILAIIFLVSLGYADAAEEFQDSIPIEVAEALFGFSTGGDLRVYSDIADGFPDFAIPRQFEVLGSSVRGATAFTVALATSLDEDDARAAITESLADEGWIDLPRFSMPAMESGFVSRDQPAMPSFTQLCHDDYGQLSVSYSDRRGRRSVTLNTGSLYGGDYRSCAERIEQQEMMRARTSQRGMGIRQYMPLLLVPEDARQGRMPFVRSTGMSSSGNTAETDTNFSIDWELQDVFQHFAEQIVEQGWAQDTESIGSITATGSWTRLSENGVNIVVRLDVVNSEGDRYDLTLRVEGPGGRGGSPFFLGN